MSSARCYDCDAVGPWTFRHALDGTIHCPRCAEDIAPACDDGEGDHSRCTHDRCVLLASSPAPDGPDVAR